MGIDAATSIPEKANKILDYSSIVEGIYPSPFYLPSKNKQFFEQTNWG